MADLRTEIKEAFNKEQSQFQPPPALRRELVDAVIARQKAGLVDGGRQPNDQWLAVAAAILITVAIVAGLMAVRLMSSHPAIVKRGPAPQLCVPGTTQSSDTFARVHACITYSDGSQIVAVDPRHPVNRIVLGPSNGLLPIAWSRDGRRLLLGSSSGLYVMNADGSEVRLNLGNAAGWGGGSFSPDGTSLVLVGYRASTSGLYVVDVNGSAPRLIAASTVCAGPSCSLSGAGSQLAYPAWAPDGSRIAYVDSRNQQSPTQQSPPSGTDEIWTMRPDGTDQRRLIDVGGCGAHQISGCTNWLAWSPDGSQLAFHSAGGIYIMRGDGSGLRRISKDGAQPTWSPDGSQIAFTRGGELFTMAQDGSNVTLLEGVVVVPNYAWAWNPAG